MTQRDQKPLQPTLKISPLNLVQCHRSRPRRPMSAAESLSSLVVPTRLPK
jgi:hypothetical protein